MLEVLFLLYIYLPVKRYSDLSTPHTSTCKAYTYKTNNWFWFQGFYFYSLKIIHSFIYQQGQYLSLLSNNSFNGMLINGNAKATRRYILTVYIWEKKTVRGYQTSYLPNVTNLNTAFRKWFNRPINDETSVSGSASTFLFRLHVSYAVYQDALLKKRRCPHMTSFSTIAIKNNNLGFWFCVR